jgi:hypothetical protein
VIDGKLEGRIEMKGRRGRRGKQLLDDLKEFSYRDTPDNPFTGTGTHPISSYRGAS